MALASRFLRCHLPVVAGLRSLINSSRAGINFMLPTCQVRFLCIQWKIIFSVTSYCYLNRIFFFNFIFIAIGNQLCLKSIVDEMEDRLKPKGRGEGGGTPIIKRWDREAHQKF